MKGTFFLFGLVMVFSAYTLNAQYLIFEHDGVEREYLLHIPDQIEPDAPLVFALHGYTGSANGLRNYIGMDAIANEFGFAVCYPNGTKDAFGNGFFNVGYAFHSDEEVDDMSFLTALADYLQETYTLSKENTFSTGMSNGGDMSYRLACQAPDVFKAIAPVAGTMMLNVQQNCPVQGIPVMEIHGTADDVTYYEGDINNVDGWGAYLSIPEVIDFWVETNQCIVSSTEVFPDLAPNDGSQVERTVYSNGLNNSEVWLYKVLEGGHDWPGAWGNMDINSSFEIWYFFSKFMEDVSWNDTSLIPDALRIAPNPNKGLINLIGIEEGIRLAYRLYDSKGILREQGQSQDAQINLSKDYSQGVYFLFLENRAYSKLIIEK